MPRIELLLPGEPRTATAPIAETYRITVERADGIACSDMEARTAMSMFCVHAVAESMPKRQRRKAAQGSTASGAA